MRAQLLLADYAYIHPEDGTVTMVRAGARSIGCPQFPHHFKAMLASRIETELGEEGDHSFDIQGIDEDGKPFLPKLTGQIKVGDGSPGVFNFALELETAFNKPGDYTFVMRIDKVICATYPLRVEQITPRKLKP